MNPTLYRYMRRNVPQKGTLYDFDRAQPGMEDAYERAREGAGPVAIDEAEQGQLDVPQQAALPGAEPEELEEFPQPFTAPPTVEAQAPVVASRATAEDDDEAGARRMDANTALARGFETAGRQFLAGMTRTPVLDTLTEQSNAVGQARTAAKTRAEQLRAAAEEARRSRLDSSTLEDNRASVIEKLARAAALSRDVRAGRDPLLDREKFEQQKVVDAQKDERERARIAKIGTGRAAGSKAPKETQLSVSALNDLSDMDTAKNQVDRAVSEFRRLKMGGWGGRTGNALTEITGASWTDSAEFNATNGIVRQAVGKILEGGKLAAGDETKYKALLLRPGDDDSVLDAKAQGLKDFLDDMKSGRIKIYREAGYKVPGGAEAAPAADGKVTVTSPTGKTISVSAKTAELLKSGKVPWPK